MKTHFLSAISVYLLISITLPSCKKDEPEAIVYPEEDMLAGYLAATGFDQTTIPVIDDAVGEFGLEFSPLVTGKITALSIALPDARPNLRVTIWQKYPTPTPIRTENVQISTANTTFEFDIPDLELTKDTSYAISMNSDDYYGHYKDPIANVIYPITSGNIIIHRFGYTATTSQLYPDTFTNAFYVGNTSFKFQRTD